MELDCSKKYWLKSAEKTVSKLNEQLNSWWPRIVVSWTIFRTIFRYRRMVLFVILGTLKCGKKANTWQKKANAWHKKILELTIEQTSIEIDRYGLNRIVFKYENTFYCSIDARNVVLAGHHESTETKCSIFYCWFGSLFPTFC